MGKYSRAERRRVARAISSYLQAMPAPRLPWWRRAGWRWLIALVVGGAGVALLRRWGL